MATFMGLCAFPGYCAKCDRLVTVNLFDKPRRCPKKHRAEPVLYNDDALVGAVGNTVVASWNHDGREMKLTDGSYFCPACHKVTLTFSDYGLMWD